MSPQRPPSVSHRVALRAAKLVGCWLLWVVAGAAVRAIKAPTNLPHIRRYSTIDGVLGLIVCAPLFLAYDRLRHRFELRGLLAALPLLRLGGGFAGYGASGLVIWARPRNWA